MQRHTEPKQPAQKDKKKKPPVRDRADTIPVNPRTDDGSRVEGEGSYEAGRRYDENAEQFAKSGQVEPTARKAADELDEDDELIDSASSDEEIDNADTRPRYKH